MFKIVPKLQHGYMRTSWGQVTWLFLSDNTCNNHCDVTVRFVTLNSSHTLPKEGNENNYLWETDQNQLQYFKLFTRIKLPHCKHTSPFVIIILIRICFPKYFIKFSLNLSKSQSFDNISYSTDAYHLKQIEYNYYVQVFIYFLFTLLMKAIYSQVRYPSHSGRGDESLTCHMTRFERFGWLRSANVINVVIG